MVSAANPYAVKAAISILEKGGSATDAAIAAHLVLGLVEPQSSGLGGGGFILNYDFKTNNLTFIDGRETAPASAKIDMFMKDDGNVMSFMEAVPSGKAVGTPGIVALYETAHKAYGLLPWPMLFEDAINLSKNGFIAVCKNNSDMINLANSLAPEHLQIMTKNPKSISSKITTSGLVLLGNYSPSSASDYLLGSNHILPTNGFGKIRGSLSVMDFIKINTEVLASKSSLSKISKHLDTLTTSEGLPNHYEAVRGRL